MGFARRDLSVEKVNEYTSIVRKMQNDFPLVASPRFFRYVIPALTP